MNDGRGINTSGGQAMSMGHEHIDYTTGRCGFLYDDVGETCVWKGELRDGMCAAHFHVVQMARAQRKANDRWRAKQKV